jgi:hypothetical protein
VNDDESTERMEQHAVYLERSVGRLCRSVNGISLEVDGTHAQKSMKLRGGRLYTLTVVQTLLLAEELLTRCCQVDHTM